MNLTKTIVFLTALLALPVVAHAADGKELVKQVIGYWAPDGDAMLKMFTEEKGMGKEDAAAMVAESSKMTFHVEEGTIHVYSKQGVVSMPYEIEKTDVEKKSITARTVNPPGAPKAQPVTFTIDGDKIAVQGGAVPFLLKKIDEAEFKKRRNAVPSGRTGP